MMITDGLPALALATATAGAVIDHRSGHIPNWLTLGSLAAAPALWFGAVTASQGGAAGLAALATSLTGAFVCGIGPAFLFWRGGLGGGDVKLFAALGAMLGPRIGINAQFLAFLVAAAFVPGRLAWEGRLLSVLAETLRLLKNPFVAKERRHSPPPELVAKLRLGPAILAGTILAFALAHRSLA